MRSHLWLIVPLVALGATFGSAQLDINLGDLVTNPTFKSIPHEDVPKVIKTEIKTESEYERTTTICIKIF